MKKWQRALMLEIIQGVNDESIKGVDDLPDMPGWFLDHPLWSAGENTAGFMPDSPYVLFFTERAARGYCRELESSQRGTDYVADMMQVTLREILNG